MNRNRRGASMIFVLFAMLLLTAMGLALMSMTESEMLMGSNSLLSLRTRLEAENGIHIAAARKVVENEGRAIEVVLPDPAGGRASKSMVNAIDIEPVAVVAERPCNFCELNNSGTYNEKSFRAVTHEIDSSGVRRAEGQTVEASRQRLAADLQLEPWKTGLDDATLFPDPGLPAAPGGTP
jgi:hypothetical protein